MTAEVIVEVSMVRIHTCAGMTVVTICHSWESRNHLPTARLKEAEKAPFIERRPAWKKWL